MLLLYNELYNASYNESYEAPYEAVGYAVGCPGACSADFMNERNQPPMQKRFSKYQAWDIGISSVSVAELEYGLKESAAPERNARVLGAFLLPLEIFLSIQWRPGAWRYSCRP